MGGTINLETKLEVIINNLVTHWENSNLVHTLAFKQKHGSDGW